MIYPIHVYGSPVLHKVSEPVTTFDEELAQLVQDMYETCEEAPGVGLAAPQIGKDMSMFIWMYDDHDGPPRGVAINPTLLIYPVDTLPVDEDDYEGCLSFPGYQFQVKRSPYALLRAQNEKGEWYELEAEGWFARILQHEFDHIKGRMYTDRLTGKDAKKVKQIIKEEGWGVPGLYWIPGEDVLYEGEDYEGEED